MAKFFIDRPIFAMALSLLIVILGSVCGFSLPIAQYPNISKPQISVDTYYVGANALTVEQSVAQAIEQKVNGVENMVDMRSTSTNTGQYNLNVYFNLEKNADIAAVEVQNRVSQATPSLPNEVNSYGITTQKQSSQCVLRFALYSPNNTYDALFLRTYATANIVDPIKRVKGMSSLDEFGPEYAMRIELQPDKMASLGVTTDDVYNAISRQNVQAAVGSIGSRPNEAIQEFSYSGTANGRLKSIEEFSNIIVRSKNGENLKVRDVAKIHTGFRNDQPYSELNGGEAVAYGIYLTSDANAVESVKHIREVLADAERRLPPDVKLLVIEDQTEFIIESLEKVAHTFVEALVLVLLVVYLFLGNWRATLVPMLAVPVSLIGTFGAFQLVGFTINTISLFAMILAIGLVVDDAIVVVEAVEHHIQDDNMSPKEATYKAMEEVSGPVVAIACVLAAVFLPMAFMGGSTGELYKQFAVTVAVSMGLSALVALSLTPALCSILLKPHDAEAAPGKFDFIDRIIKAFNAWFDRTLEKYVGVVGICVRRVKLMTAGLLVLVILAVFVSRITPSGYVPEEDTGLVIASFTLPEGASSTRSIHLMKSIAEKAKNIEGVAHVLAVNGYDILASAPKSSAGLIVLPLKDFSERSNSSFDIIKQMMALGQTTPEANIMAFNDATLPGLSSTGSLGMYIMNLGGDPTEVMAKLSQEFVAKAQKRPEIGVIYTNFKTDTPAYVFEVNREKAESLKVPVKSVYSALQAYLGGIEVNDFNDFGRIWKVVMQADMKYRGDVRNLSLFYVRSNDDKMVSLDSLVDAKQSLTVPTVERYNNASAFKVAGSPAPGYSTGQAMKALEEVAAEVLPVTYSYAWVDQSRDEREAGSNTFFLYSISLAFVFLVLAALYESWSIPLAVMLSIPPAMLGCFGSQLLRGQQNDIYMQVALITLIGLTAKNAILIIEYAKMNLENGMPVLQATIEASKLRLRPILMTSFAFILGCIPLAIATGASSAARVSMGNAVVGGMTFSTGVGIFLIPAMFVLIEWFFDRDKFEKDAKL